ncbi:MAG: FAD:protein FMN transferase [Deltaproteobacteria bacterium]|nr:FAD:protein FMN transferase [Deltaproteobacteria bacterium]
MAVLGAVLLLAGSGCGAPASRHEVRSSGEALGTTWSVKWVSRAAPQPGASDELRDRVAAVLERVDRGMSTWREDAELARFNRQAELTAFEFSAETRGVIVAALAIARETNGAFDPTVGPLVALWGFGPDAALEEPTEQELERQRARVGWPLLAWDREGRMLRRLPGVQLDLSAIAKGYAVDAIVRELVRDRPLGLLVEVGGEVRALGTTLRGEPWRLGIQDPTASGDELEAVIALTGAALATSGDYRNLRVVAGKRRSHVIDPRTGRPLDNRVASASVVAPTCMEADAAATALMVLGPDLGMAWVEERPWLDALLLLRRGDEIVERRASSRWVRWEAPGP